MKTISLSILALVALGALFATDDFKLMVLCAWAFALIARFAYVAYRVERGNRVL